MGGGREDRARAEVVRAVLVSGLGSLDRFSRRTDDLVRAEQAAAHRDRQVACADVHARGVARKRDVHAVVDDERHVVPVGHCLDALRQRKIRAAATVLFAQLDERCAACARLVDRVQQGLVRVVGAVCDDIKGGIELHKDSSFKS